ncbi:hypothetical protein BpHYR1_019185 [Brachionus plicatilis]|uniref:SWIM-type domain-containing protein n=1 Tax=Brachionus plicatilis TaxID=10195 RepID=A0A3M7QQK1_BRAPC|nr:hypothetical protein BpHYR1_019185 [Brachionus plicatilis]
MGTIKKIIFLSLLPIVTDIESSEVHIEFIFIPICSCQEHELIIMSRCELSAKCICQHFEASNFLDTSQIMKI